MQSAKLCLPMHHTPLHNYLSKYSW
jgi:hypothetical protein